jgi:carboxymethylenebutenolidase
MPHDPRCPDSDPDSDVSRRTFVALSVAGGLAVATAATASGLPVVESEVAVTTPDGRCNAAFFHPASGVHPGVIIWPDAFGLRPSMRTMARRLAGKGYAVLVPNPFYRIGPGPFYDSAATVDFRDPATMQKLGPLMGSVNATGAAERDAIAHVAFLDAQAPVDKARRIGTQGYCMGGALVLRSAAALPDRIGAGASFHGGGLVSDKAESPHLLAPRIRARLYVGVAQNDDRRQPEAKDRLKEAFAAAGVPAQVEVYPALHGWCVPDMPTDAGAPIYNAVEAERAWAKLLELYQAALA